MIFKGYWAFLEPNSWEEVGDCNQLSQLFNQGYVEAIWSCFEELFDGFGEQRC
jgi:hypothetical protein